LRCGEEKIDDAIAVVKKANGQPGADALFSMLHDYLIGYVAHHPYYSFMTSL
jgi:hypothetical protein